jgi:hypothetical protein
VQDRKGKKGKAFHVHTYASRVKRGGWRISLAAIPNNFNAWMKLETQ